MNGSIVVENTSKKTTLASSARRASGLARFVGLLLTADLPEGSGLLLERTRQVHMFFMRYPIDVLFLDTDHTVLACIRELQPWSVSPHISDAKLAVELPAGTLEKTATVPGDHLAIREQEQS